MKEWSIPPEKLVKCCIWKLLSSQNQTLNIWMRRGLGLAGGKENCSSCRPEIMTHMFSFPTAVLPPNPKGQQTIHRAGYWTCWGDDVPVQTRGCPLRSWTFKLHAQGSIFSLFQLSPSPQRSGKKVLKIQERLIWTDLGKNTKLYVP